MLSSHARLLVVDQLEAPVGLVLWSVVGCQSPAFVCIGDNAKDERLLISDNGPQSWIALHRLACFHPTEA